MTRPRLMPSPPPRPVRKKAGGPPIGPLIAPKTKKLALPLGRRCSRRRRTARMPRTGREHARRTTSTPPSTVLSRPPASDTPDMSADIASPMRSTDQLVIDRTSPPCQVIISWSTAAVRPKIDSCPVNSSEISVTLPVGLDGVEPDAVDVERAELALDDQPPRAGRVAGRRVTVEGLARRRVLLDGQRRAERRPVVGARAADVVHDLVRDAVAAAARARPPGRRVGSWRRRRHRPAGLGVHVERDAVERDRPQLEQRAGLLAETQADPGDDEARHQIEVVGIWSLEHENRQPRLHCRVDPAGVNDERNGHPRGGEVELLARGQGQVQADLPLAAA